MPSRLFPATPSTLHRNNHGFTLVELAVVIGIISLMIGGILVGQSMIRSSQMQATVAKVEEYTGAVRKFRDVYFALPGDMRNATTLWGHAVNNANCLTPSTDTAGNGVASGTGTQTCNGNGDGKIGNGYAGGQCLNAYWEIFRAWQHLSNAGLVEGRFTGRHGPAGTRHAVAGTNVPRTALQPGGYTMVHCGELIANPEGHFNGIYGHVIMVGGYNASNDSFTRLPLFTTSEAGAIDEKFDDSYPHTGIIRATRNGIEPTPDCTNSAAAAPATADYDFNATGTKCALVFLLGF